MTPREVILANIACESEGRIGLEFTEPAGAVRDIAGVGCSHGIETKKWVEGDTEFTIDMWGNLWHRKVGMSQGGEVLKPVIEDWKDLDRIELPDLANPANFEGARNLGKSDTDKFRMGSVPGWVFSTARYMRKMEVYFMDLCMARDHLDVLHERVTDLFEGVIEQYGKAGLDGIFFCEDLGIQDRLLISPEMFRDALRPHYERLTAKAHEYGMKVIEHSCGYNWDLVDDLCEAGIDCLQFDQPAVYDQPALAAKLKSYGVGLFSPCDIQQVLPTGDEAYIRAETARLVENFRGGFIGKNYPDLHGIGVDPQWNAWAYEAFLEAGAPEFLDAQAANA